MTSTTRSIPIALAATAVVLMACPAAAADLDWLLPPLGDPCAPRPVVTARTTYMPRFVASPADVAPALPGPAAPGAAPAVAAPGACAACAPAVCTPCAAPTLQYVPQTCYRTVVARVPVACYAAETVCDPCTGCAQTCYRPVPAYVHRARLVPYTIYRPVLTPPLAAAPGVSMGVGVPTLSSGATACPSCQGTSVILNYAPAIPSEQRVERVVIEEAEDAESAAAGEAESERREAFRPEPSPAEAGRPEAAVEGPLVPIPARKDTPEPKPEAPQKAVPGVNSPTGAPIPPVAPGSGDRVTKRRAAGADLYRPASHGVQPERATVVRDLGDGGWRPARD